MPKLASVEIDTPANKGETKIRRSYRAPDKLLERPAEGINTMADVFLHARNRKCLPSPTSPSIPFRLVLTLS